VSYFLHSKWSVCFEMNVDSDLLTEVPVKIGDKSFNVRAEFACKPAKCVHCKCFGHSSNKCAMVKTPKATLTWVPTQPVVETEGWNTVQNKSVVPKCNTKSDTGNVTATSVTTSSRFYILQDNVDDVEFNEEFNTNSSTNEGSESRTLNEVINISGGNKEDGIKTLIDVDNEVIAEQNSNSLLPKTFSRARR